MPGLDIIRSFRRVERVILRGGVPAVNIRRHSKGRGWGRGISVLGVSFVGDEKLSGRDIRLAGRALSERWPMPEGRLLPLVDRIALVAESEGSKPRERLAATRVLLQVARLNLEAIEVAGRSDYADALAELRALKAEMGRAQLGDYPAGDPPVEGVGGAASVGDT